MAKSITSTLVGAAMKDGYIRSLDDPVTQYITALRGSAYDGVTVHQLLTMTSGVKWNEDYTDPNSDVARMYAQAPRPRVRHDHQLRAQAPARGAARDEVGLQDVGDQPGRRARRGRDRQELADYLSEKIWRPYGMERDAEWMIDDVGDEQGGCCLGMTLRDDARFGEFILDGARVDGQSIVPDDWLPEATRTQVSIGPGAGYGYQWWTRDEESDRSRGGRGAAGVHRRRPGGGRRRAVRRRRRVSLWRGMRRRWADGTTHLEWKGVDFLGRLAVLVPQPRINLLLYCIWTRPQVSVGRHEDWTSRLQPRAGGAMMCHRQPWQNRSSVCRI